MEASDIEMELRWSDDISLEKAKSPSNSFGDWCYRWTPKLIFIPDPNLDFQEKTRKAMFGSYFKEAITIIRKYSSYINDNTILGLQPLSIDNQTDTCLNIMTLSSGVAKLTKIKNIKLLHEEPKDWLKIPMDGINIFLNIEAIKDNTKEIEKLKSLIQKTKDKLNNEKFLSNAPPKVVEAEKQKLASFEAQLKNIDS